MNSGEAEARSRSTSAEPPPRQDEGEHPIAGAWRETLRAVVQALVEGDYSVARGVPSLEPVDAETAQQIQDYVEDYGETLVALPEQTWESSIASWQGTHWDLLVDLWTESEGCSDLVLSARVVEVEGGYRFRVEMVYVP